MAIIPHEVDVLTDKDDLNDNDVEEDANVNAFTETYEVHLLIRNRLCSQRQSKKSEWEKVSKNYSISLFTTTI